MTARNILRCYSMWQRVWVGGGLTRRGNLWQRLDLGIRTRLNNLRCLQRFSGDRCAIEITTSRSHFSSNPFCSFPFHYPTTPSTYEARRNTTIYNCWKLNWAVFNLLLTILLLLLVRLLLPFHLDSLVRNATASGPGDQRNHPNYNSSKWWHFTARVSLRSPRSCRLFRRRGWPFIL